MLLLYTLYLVKTVLIIIFNYHYIFYVYLAHFTVTKINKIMIMQYLKDKLDKKLSLIL
jgi:hypothetical protein